MDQKIRKAVRTFLIKNGHVVTIKYKTEKNNGYYDIPGGKIEENETAEQASKREFMEETGINVIKQERIGHTIIEYPNIIFDLELFNVIEYQGEMREFDENTSQWIEMSDLITYDGLPSIEILKYIDSNNINIKIISDENHKIQNVMDYEFVSKKYRKK